MTIQNVEREAELLGTLLKSPELLKATSLRPEQFGDRRNQQVFRAMRQLQDKILTPTELKRELDRVDAGIGVEYISAIIALQPEKADIVRVKVLSDKIAEDAARVEAIQATEKALAQLRQPAQAFDSGLNQLANIVIAAQNLTINRASPVIADIIDSQEGNVFGRRFYSGWSLIDLTTRGFREGQVWNINAPYKSYKTRWMLNIVLGILAEGGSASIQMLEDNAGAVKEKLIAMITGFHEQDVEMYYEPDCPIKVKQTMKQGIEDAEAWLREQKLRVYDHRHDVHNHETMMNRVIADKMMYDTNIHVIDHINQFGDDPEILGNVYRSLVPMAQKAQVTILGLSQQSNASILYGTQSNMLATRGTGVAGAVVHFGLEVHKPGYGEGRIKVDKMWMDKLQSEGITGIQEQDVLEEVGLHLKILRRGRPTKFWGLFEPTSGKLLGLRSDRGEPTDENYGSWTGWDWTKK